MVNFEGDCIVNAANVAHAVGPNFHTVVSQREGIDLLTSAYRDVLRICAEHGNIKTVAFPPLSAGLFRGTQTVLQIMECAIFTLNQSSKKFCHNISEIFFVAHTDDELSEMKQAARKIFY